MHSIAAHINKELMKLSFSATLLLLYIFVQCYNNENLHNKIPTIFAFYIIGIFLKKLFLSDCITHVAKIKASYSVSQRIYPFNVRVDKT